jgi:hypothetical protein
MLTRARPKQASGGFFIFSLQLSSKIRSAYFLGAKPAFRSSAVLLMPAAMFSITWATMGI